MRPKRWTRSIRTTGAGVSFYTSACSAKRQTYQMVMHEVKPGWTITKEWEGYTVEADIEFSEINPEEYLGIYFSGGRAPEYLRYDKDLVQITRHFFETGKPIASVCHGVEIPASLGASRDGVWPRSPMPVRFGSLWRHFVNGPASSTGTW